MVDVVVRDPGDVLERRLHERSSEHGRSVEDGARNILATALDMPDPGTGASPDLGTRMARRFAGLGLREEDFPEVRGEEARAADLGR